MIERIGTTQQCHQLFHKLWIGGNHITIGKDGIDGVIGVLNRVRQIAATGQLFHQHRILAGKRRITVTKEHHWQLLRASQ